MAIPPPPPALADWFEMLSWLAALVMAGLALRQFRDSVAQRREEQRWRRTEAGMKLIAEMIDDEDYRRAAMMLDMLPVDLTEPDGGTITVTEAKLRAALSAPDPAGELAFICFSFDGLFWHMAKFEHFIHGQLIDVEHVAFPVSYYIECLAPYKQEVMGYLQRNHMAQALAFLRRHNF